LISVISKKLDDSKFCMTALIFFMGVYAIISGLVGGYTDLYAFDTQWFATIDNLGLTHMYVNDAIINYPPIYMILLWIIHKPLVYFFNFVTIPSDFPFIFWFIFKSVDFIPLFIGVLWIYKKISPKMSVIIMLSLSIFSNVALFGQRDACLCIIIVMFLYYMKKYDYTKMCIVFAFMCLYKTQAAVFVLPLLGFGIVSVVDKLLKWIDVVKGLFIGGSIGYLVWLPFTIANKDILFPLNRYLGFTDSHYEISHGSINIWFIYDSFFNIHEYTYEANHVFQILNTVISLIICGIYIYYLLKVDKKYNAPLSLFAAMSIWCLFSMNQHDRFYMYPMIILLTLVFVYNVKAKIFTWIYVGYDLLAGIMIVFGYLRSWYMLCFMTDKPSVLDDVFTAYADSDLTYMLVLLLVLIGIYFVATYMSMKFIIAPDKHIILGGASNEEN